MNFKDYLKVIEEYALASDYAGGPIQTTDQTGSEMDNRFTSTGHDIATVPGYDIGLPQVTRRGKVMRLDYGKRLIEIQLEDRTLLQLTRAQFERIGGDKVVPHKSILTVTFQRNPWDTTKSSSQVTSVRCEALPQVRQ
jgi:hypothetical protein